MRTSLVLAVILCAPAVAEARDPIASCIGANGLFGFSLIGGDIAIETDDEDREGVLVALRMHFCAAERRTRFGTLMGWEANLEGGGIGTDLQMPAPDVDTSRSNGHFDLSFGANASLFYRFAGKGKWMLVTSRRFALRGGFGINLDYAYGYGGAELALLATPSIGIELGYVYVPAGLSWDGSAYEVSEHRPTLGVNVQVSKGFSIAITAEPRIGSHKTSEGMAAPGQALVGNYKAILFSLGFRMNETARD